MRRYVHFIPVLGAVGLLALLLMLAASAQPAVRADGNVIKVPDDYATIQAAIDAAADGDTILVAGSVYDYKENLTISKGITLSGGWNITFTQQYPGESVLDGQGLGRVISITCPSSDTVVTVEGFTIWNGNATGLAGLPPVPEGLHSGLQGSMSQSSQELPDTLTPAEHASRLRTDLGDLAARGLYPGGPAAYEAMAAKLGRLTAQAEQALARSGSTANRPDQSPGAGGGIYSWNASLRLLNCTVEDNVASVNGDGYGGGVFVGQAAPSGVVIAHNVLRYNTASDYAEGKGGGLYLFQTPGAVVEKNQFLENTASNGGLAGVGGGLYVDGTAGVLVQGNHLERNTAHASWDCPPMGGGGIGGGAQFRMTDDAIVTDNVFRDNLAALHCGSHGGGFYVYRAENIRLEGNQVIDNCGVLFQVYSDDFGGGVGMDTVYNATVHGNVVRGNATSLITEHKGMHVSYGGGIFGYALRDSQIRLNEIAANLASNEWTGFGGGMHLVGTEGVVLGDNLFADNVAGLQVSADGTGGGLDLRNTVDTLVQHNHFVGNLASADGPGYAGGLDVASWGPYSVNTTVDANLFLDNQASGSPAAHAEAGACQIVTHGFAFTNNVVAGNTARDTGGLVLLGFEEGGVVINNTLGRNSDAAITVLPWTTPVTFTNNIVVSHTVGISVSQQSTATVRYTLWDGNGVDIAGSGVISQTHPLTGTPGFVRPADHDYHLTLCSAAINAGDPAGVPPAPDDDADRVARPQGVAVDLGAYEWRGHWEYLPLVAKSFTPRTGWAIGPDATGTAVIVHTADGGLTWQVQGDSTAWTGPGNDISAVDDHTAWAALGSGLAETDIVHTTDGGVTWVGQAIPPGVVGEVKGVKGLSRNEAWAASLGGTILHTTDGGATWNIVPHPTVPITQVNRIDAMGTNVWIADAAAAGAIVHTQDGGLTWRAEYLPDGDSPLIVHALSPMAVWGSGSDIEQNPSFYRTVDGGEQWVQVAQVGALDHLDDVCAAGPDDVWGVVNGEESSGFIWRVHVEPDSTPDARNLTPPELLGYNAEGVTCLDTRVAWVAAQMERVQPGKPLGIILHTTDGGETWVRQSAPTHVEYWKVSFVGARR